MSVAAAREPDDLPPDFALTVTSRSGPAAAVSSRTHRAIKRTLDLVLASLALLVAIPVGLVIAIAVKLTSRGPVFYIQERVGEGGALFNLVKFRSMRDGTHEEVMSCDELQRAYRANDFKLAIDDPRITPTGRVLRSSSLDELPQLLNVLRGDMSLVGIRPLLAPELVLRSQYEQQCYLALKPGMTGLWQVEGRSSVQAESRRILDCLYVERWSLSSDVRILLRTPHAVLKTSHAR